MVFRSLTNHNQIGIYINEYYNYKILSYFEVVIFFQITEKSKIIYKIEKKTTKIQKYLFNIYYITEYDSQDYVYTEMFK